MTALLNLIATHPLQDIEVSLSFLAGIAFILFLRGFLSGLQQLIQINMDAEHLEHARTRAMWGMMLLWVLFGIWEVVRFVVASLQGESIEHLSGIIAMVVFVGVVFFLLPYLLLPKKGGH